MATYELGPGLLYSNGYCYWLIVGTRLYVAHKCEAYLAFHLCWKMHWELIQPESVLLTSSNLQSYLGAHVCTEIT